MDAKYYVNECLSAKAFGALWKKCERSQFFHRIMFIEDNFGGRALELRQVAGATAALTKELEAYGVPRWVLRQGDTLSGEKVMEFCQVMSKRARRMRNL